MIVATPNGGKKRRKNQQQNQPEVGVCLRSQSCCAIPAAIVPSAQPTSPTAVDSPPHCIALIVLPRVAPSLSFSTNTFSFRRFCFLLLLLLLFYFYFLVHDDIAASKKGKCLTQAIFLSSRSRTHCFVQNAPNRGVRRAHGEKLVTLHTVIWTRKDKKLLLHQDLYEEK